MVASKLAGLLARIDGYPVHDLYDKVLARVERPLFGLVLAHTGGNQLKAAAILGLNRNTLRKKLATLGMEQRGPSRSAARSTARSYGAARSSCPRADQRRDAKRAGIARTARRALAARSMRSRQRARAVAATSSPAGAPA